MLSAQKSIIIIVIIIIIVLGGWDCLLAADYHSLVKKTFQIFLNTWTRTHTGCFLIGSQLLVSACWASKRLVPPKDNCPAQGVG